MDEMSPKSVQQKWALEIEQAEKPWKKFHKRASEIIKIYEDERRTGVTGSSSNKMNLLWSNTETLRPALYSNTPTPEVMRRNKDKDQLGLTVSEVLERSLSYCLDSYDFDGLISLNVKDYTLTALGVAWVVYDPEIEMFEDENGEQYEDVTYENAKIDYVHWKDFLCNAARTWDEVRWVSRIHYLTKNQLKELAPKVWREIPLDDVPEEYKDAEDPHGLFKKAKVYEIWDKESGNVYFISKAYKDGPIVQKEPAVNFHGFFPCPRPLMGVTGKTIHPVPDYALYQDQVDEINRLTDRIYNLTNALKVSGAYDGNFPELGAILDEDTGNVLVPVDNWSQFTAKGGTQGSISLVPLKEVVAALQAAYEARERAKADLYEVTGLSDIVRGASDPQETATAQAIKNQWGSLRIRDRQKEIQRYVRDLIRLKAEVIAEHFSMKTLSEMSGVKLLTAEQKQAAQMAASMGQQIPEDMQEILRKPTWEDVMGLLKNDRLRSFSINIETDSTMEPDESQEKQNRTEFLTAVGGFLQQAVEATERQPALAPLVGEMLTFGVRGFKAGRQLEDVIEQTVEQMKQIASQPKQPDPVEMAKAETDKQKTQIDGMNAQTKAKEVEYDRMTDIEKNKIDAAKLTQDAIQRERERQTVENPGFM